MSVKAQCAGKEAIAEKYRGEEKIVEDEIGTVEVEIPEEVVKEIGVHEEAEVKKEEA